MTLSSVLDLARHFFPDKLIRRAIEYLQRVQILPKKRVSMQGFLRKSVVKSISYVKHGIFRCEPFKIKTAAENKLE
jgi:hypothetical protein